MGRLDNKVAFVTGAARGQGRAHVLRLAEEGADIVAIDACAPIDTVPYDMATSDELAGTAKLVEDMGRRIIYRQGDTRDLAGLQSLVSDAVDEFGGIDIVVANAGITSFAPSWELTEQQWQDVVDINLTGVWKTAKAVIPSMIDRGRGGSIILTSSVAGLVAYGNLAHYTAAKHGVTGLMRALSLELAPHNIRVNSVHPTTVNTPMLNNPAIYNLFFPHIENATQEDAEAGFIHMNGLKVPWVEPIDVSNAVLHLASDETRYVTGTTQVIDAGGSAPYKFPHAL
ncbi:(-)-trans-carveol dehydrogenase (plasmid) [Rhodococcus ruber]|uniref:mycofactocin-coupled SDR family oxidoreductase n=2 Tax=Rhodococcus ruber TaxID=1830 RepID=UPI00315CE377